MPFVGKRKTDEGRPPQVGVISAAAHRGLVERFSPPLCKIRTAAIESEPRRAKKPVLI